MRSAVYENGFYEIVVPFQGKDVAFIRRGTSQSMYIHVRTSFEIFGVGRTSVIFPSATFWNVSRFLVVHINYILAADTACPAVRVSR